MSDYVMFCRRAGQTGILDFYDPKTRRGQVSGKTVDELAKEYGVPVTIVLYENAVAEDRAAIISGPVEISETEYSQFLAVLPPARYNSVGGAVMFCVPEPIYADIVNWCVSYKGRYFLLKNSIQLPSMEVKQIVSDFLRGE